VVAGRTTAVRSRALSPETALLALGTIVVAVATAWSGDALQVAGGDYSTSYERPLNALLDGRLGTFFANLPVNGAGGSLLLRAPFAGLARLLGGDQLLVYRLGALACLLALGALALWIAGDLRLRGVSLASRVGLVALCAAAPALLEAVALGHPEEPLGAALCVAAVLAAGRGRPLLAGALLGAAAINKPWGVLAVGPALLCAPAGQRARTIAPAGAIVGCWLAAGALVAPARLLDTLRGAELVIVAHPQDLWWPLHHMDGLYPVPPALLASHARQLAVALALACALALALRALRARAAVGMRRCLALLALGFAFRCLLEPSSHGYYQLPLLIALAAWELYARRSVAIALLATFLLTLDFGRLDESATATASYLLYLAVLLPICALLIAEIRRPLGGRPRADDPQGTAALTRRQPGWPRRSRSPSGAG
jgi:hypothetical protein